MTSTYVVEFILVDVLRHGARFDPHLSLVAEVAGDVACHALFYPFQVFVAGEPVQAVSLAPIAVTPARQRQGIGGRLEERLVSPADVGWLVGTWHTWFEDVDLALFPGSTLLDWITHSKGIISTVIVRDGEPIGYLRYERDDPGQVKLFLAQDRAVREWLDLPYETVSETWEAAMIKVLDPGNEAISRYCDRVSSGRRKPGLVIYPPCIELAT